MRNFLRQLRIVILAAPLCLLVLSFSMPAMASAGLVCGGGKDAYGKANPTVRMSFNLGCTGHGNPILDVTFAIIRFLSAGVGLVIVGSMIVAGIQYIGSRGDPNATAQAINRIRSNVIALLLYIFGFAILNYIIPGQLLK
jgi:hypothetical protein